MSIQYRAIWQDNDPDLIDKGRDIFQAWLNGKHPNMQIPLEGHLSDGPNEIRLDNVEASDVRALRIRLNEVRAVSQGHERWTTTALWMQKGNEGWIWIDVEWVSHDIYDQPPDISAPKLVSMLLNQGTHSNLKSNLGPTPLKVKTEPDIVDLITSIYSPQRTVPVILYSVDRIQQRDGLQRRASEAARRLAGCADVRVLTDESQHLFHEIMNPLSLSVYGGAVRIYLPGLQEADPQPWRHRYILARYLSDTPFRAATPIIRRVLPRMIAQQPPEIYRTAIAPIIGKLQRDWKDYAIELDDEISELRDDIRRLNSNIESITLDRDIAFEEAIESERAAYKARRSLDRLRSKFRQSGDNPDVIEQEIVDHTAPSSCDDAIQLGKELQHIVIHPDAPRDIERLDQHEHSELWGQRIYVQIRALNSYSESKVQGFDGGFKEWCSNSRSPDVISAKFIAMKESQYVRTNRRLMKHRQLPIEHTVSPNGWMTMESHLKPIEGGGMQIPRIYFYDDTRGQSGKVHIGFVGPHDLMPNKSAN